jgi:hypothetical protein
MPSEMSMRINENADRDGDRGVAGAMHATAGATNSVRTELARSLHA